MSVLKREMIKHLNIALVAILFFSSSCTQRDDLKVHFQTNRIHSLYNFVETISGMPHRSLKLKETFEKSAYNTPEVQTTLKEFRDLSQNLGNGFNFEGFPKSRRMGQSIDLVFVVRSIYSKDLNDFSNRTVSLLPIGVHSELFNILKKLEPIHQKLIWSSHESDVNSYKSKMEDLAKKVDLGKLFDLASQFYNASWPKDLSFVISFYPIPGKTGHTSAESIGNVESVGILTEESDYAGRFGVLFHEMCHSLYESQTASFQKELEKWFDSSPSKYAKYAYRYLNEAVATAIGNGWAFEKASGSVDTRQWYNNRYINDFAKALYPMVKRYIESSKTIDQAFISEAIAIFESTLPDILHEYDNLMFSVSLISDNKSFKPKDISPLIHHYFRVSSINRSAPIQHQFTLEEIEGAKNSTVFAVLKKSEVSQLEWLASKHKPLNKFKGSFASQKHDFIFSTLDTEGRAYIFIVLSGSDLDPVLKKIKEVKKFDPKSPFLFI